VSLLVGGGLVQVELKLLLDAAVSWSAQEGKDAVQSRVFLDDFAELGVGIKEGLLLKEDATERLGQMEGEEVLEGACQNSAARLR
jgi:hypothetical protein